MKKYIMLIAAISMLMGSCQNEEEFAAGNEVQIDAIYPSSDYSRVANNQFENDDEIGFYMVQHADDRTPVLELAGNYASNIKATYNGSRWVCSPSVLWENSTFDFYAYYPYMKEPNSVDELAFEVELDQSGDGYTESDFLWARSLSIEATKSAIPLSFAHRLSRINIVFAKGDDYTGDLPRNAEVYIHNTIPNAIINLRTGDAVSNDKLPAQTIKARYISGASYEAIIVPQRINHRVPLIEVIVNNISYLVESRFIFQSGMSYTYKVILSDNPDKIKIEVSGGIENFN